MWRKYQIVAKKHYLCGMERPKTANIVNADTPRVSVVICTYNGGKYLRDQLDSVIGQTCPLHEIIIQDDKSTDDTMTIAKEYAAHHTNIHIHVNTDVHGINGNFFSAMKKATGEYIAICDQDDIWEPDKISCQIQAIGDKLMCSCLSRPFSEDGSFVHYDSRVPNFNLYRLLFNNEIHGHTIVMNRRLLDRIPQEGLDEMCRLRIYDAILAITAAAYDSIVFIDKALINHRRYQTAATYASYDKCMPTVKNALYILFWSIRHYSKVKKLTLPRELALLNYLQHLDNPSQVCAECIEITKLRISDRFIDLIRLTLKYINHRFEIFHTKGKDPVNFLRAIQFPFTSLYYRRLLLNSSIK